MNRPPEQLSVSQNVALAATGPSASTHDRQSSELNFRCHLGAVCVRHHACELHARYGVLLVQPVAVRLAYVV